MARISLWLAILPSVIALTTTSNHLSSTTATWQRQRDIYHQQRTLRLNLSNIEADVTATKDFTKLEENTDVNAILTSAVITCAYDGTYFRGWTAGNSDQMEVGKMKNNKNSNSGNTGRTHQPEKRRQSRRSRTLQRKGRGYGKNGIRTVDDTIRSALAKVYGNIDANRIKIECCSRTDAGVHATSLVAQFYCVKEEPTQSIPMRPNACDDTSNFLPLPFDSDLSKLVFVLNRMLPPDVRIVAASPLPQVPSTIPTRGGAKLCTVGSTFAFHPTLHTMSKTYTYQFAIGPVHDPLETQHVWHLDGSSSRAVGMNGKRFCLERALLAANLFVDSNDANMSMITATPRDYGAFRSAFRGTDRGRIQSTICKLWRCEILQEKGEQLPSWEVGPTNDRDAPGDFERHGRVGSRLGTANSTMDSYGLNTSPQRFTVVITGDRFLYKMIRNIVGTIVAVGCGHMELEDVEIALDTGKWGGNTYNIADESIDEEAATDEVAVAPSSEPGAEKRTIRRICAPARGLTLVEVKYPAEVCFNWETG